MRFLLCLSLLLLSACTASVQAVQVPNAPADSAGQVAPRPKDSTLFANTPAAQPDLTAAPIETAAAPAAALGSSIILAVNEKGRSQPNPQIYPVDVITGQVLSDYPPITAWPQILSADGKVLAAIESHGRSCESHAGGTACRHRADVLHLVDLPTWRDLAIPLPGDGWVWPILFGPGAGQLALGYTDQTSSQLMLFDSSSGELLGQRGLEFRPQQITFSLEGGSLVVYGQPAGEIKGISKPGSLHLLLLTVPALEIQWDQTLEMIVSGDWCLEKCEGPHEKRSFAYWQPAVIPSHDGRKLYIVHADADQLTSMDFAAHTVQTVEIQPARSWIEKLLALTADVARAKGGENGTSKDAVLSADGSKLYVVGRAVSSSLDEQGNWNSEEGFMGLQVVDAETGLILESRGLEATGIQITPDGAYLILEDWRSQEIRVLDAASLQPVKRLAGWWAAGFTRRVDGKALLLLQRYDQADIAVLDARSFEVLQSWSGSKYHSGATIP